MTIRLRYGDKEMSWGLPVSAIHLQDILDRRLAPEMVILCLHTETVQFMCDPRRREMSFCFPVEHHLHVRRLALIDCKRIRCVSVAERCRIGVVPVLHHIKS